MQQGQGRGHAGHMPAVSDQRALIISGWLTGIYFLVELGIGLWTGSVAVTSDAFHTFSAVGGVLIALIAGQFAQRRASIYQTFGLIRAEIVGALLNGLFLVLMAGVVLWMGAMRLMHPMELATTPMLVAAGGGILVELVALRLLYRGQKGNLNLKGAYWHILQTFVGSFIIIVSALVIRFTGFLQVDPLLGMAFGLVLLWASWGIIRDATNILLQRTPSDLDLPGLVRALEEIPGVEDVHHVHAWSLTPGKVVFSAHVCVGEDTQSDQVRLASERVLREDFQVYFSTIQTEHACRDREAAASEIDVLDQGTRRARDAPS